MKISHSLRVAKLILCQACHLLVYYGPIEDLVKFRINWKLSIWRNSKYVLLFVQAYLSVKKENSAEVSIRTRGQREKNVVTFADLNGSADDPPQSEDQGKHFLRYVFLPHLEN